MDRNVLKSMLRNDLVDLFSTCEENDGQTPADHAESLAEIWTKGFEYMVANSVVTINPGQTVTTTCLTLG